MSYFGTPVYNSQYTTSPPVGDNSNRTANTSWIKANGETFGSLSSINANTSLGANALGQAFLVTATGLTITLPAISVAPNGSVISFSLNGYSGTGSTTFNTASAGDKILVAGGGNVTTMAGFSGDFLQFVSNGTTWTLSSTQQGLTQAQFDSSGNFATTNWVNQNGVRYASSPTTVGATSTMSPASVNAPVLFNGASTFTYTIPLASSVPLGTMLEFMSACTGKVTVSAQGTDKILTESSNTNYSPILASGDNLRLINAGSGTWVAVGGSAVTIKSANWAFSQTGTYTGYMKLPTGLMLQWVGASFLTAGIQTITVTLPLSFTSAIYTVNVGGSDNANNNDTPVQWRPTGSTLSSLIIYTYGAIASATGCQVWALGV